MVKITPSARVIIVRTNKPPTNCYNHDNEMPASADTLRAMAPSEKAPGCSTSLSPNSPISKPTHSINASRTTMSAGNGSDRSTPVDMDSFPSTEPYTERTELPTQWPMDQLTTHSSLITPAATGDASTLPTWNSSPSPQTSCAETQSPHVTRQPPIAPKDTNTHRKTLIAGKHNDNAAPVDDKTTGTSHNASARQNLSFTNTFRAGADRLPPIRQNVTLKGGKL